MKKYQGKIVEQTEGTGYPAKELLCIKNTSASSFQEKQKS
jgi:hypothetical protein